MTLLEEEKKILQNFKQKLSLDRELNKQELLQLTEKYDDLIEIASVSIKIIDNLVANQRRSSSL